MIVHPLMEVELCFACVLLMKFFAIDEIADIFGFAGHRLFDDVFMAIICAADGGIEHIYISNRKNVDNLCHLYLSIYMRQNTRLDLCHMGCQPLFHEKKIEKGH